MFTISEQIKNISILLNPIIPLSTNKVLETMNISANDLLIKNISNQDIFNHDIELKEIDILFKKIEDDN